MRRGAALILAVATLVGLALLLARSRARRTATPKPLTGMFANAMAYARLGFGPKTLLVIPGGPGNEAPSGMTVRMFLPQFRPYVEAGYSVWYVTRKRGMPEGHSMADIAADYAELIAAEFDGRVDLVVGISYGGMVGFYLAADHPERTDHIAIVVAGYAVSERGKAIDLGFARALSEGRPGDAMTTMLEGLSPEWFARRFARPIGAALGPIAFRRPHPSFASDVLIEAEAEVACDAREVLPRIGPPVLLVSGDADVYFPDTVIAETARLIPECTLRLYPDRGHMRVSSDVRVARDVLEFVRRRESNGQGEQVDGG